MVWMLYNPPCDFEDSVEINPPSPILSKHTFFVFFSCQVFKVDISLVLDHHWIGTRIWWPWPEISLHPCRHWPFPKWQPLQLPSCMPLFGRIKPWQARNRQTECDGELEGIFLGGQTMFRKRKLGNPSEKLFCWDFVSSTFCSHCLVVFFFSNRNIPRKIFVPSKFQDTSCHSLWRVFNL